MNKYEHILPMGFYRRSPKLVVLVCLPRTGSNHLLSTMGYHPQFVSFYELFHRRANKRTTFYRHRYLDGEDPVEFIELIKNYRYRRRVRAVAFKLIYSQAFHPEFQEAWEYLRGDPDVCFLHLTRENRLAQLTSLRTAQATKVWVQRNKKFPSVPQLHLDKQECLQHFENSKKQSETVKIALSASISLELSYEDLVGQKIETLNRITGFLNLRPKYNHRLKEATEVQRRGTLRERISNYDELRLFFQDSKYACYFE